MTQTCIFAAYRSGGRERLPLFHNFSTNSAPINGSCDVVPKLGYAYNAIENPIQTLFNVTCGGYTDPDEPLNYSLAVDYTGLSAIPFIAGNVSC